MARRSEKQKGESGLYSDVNAGRELAWIVVICVLAAVLAIQTNAVTRVIDWVGSFDALDLSPLLALLVIIPFAATFFSVRRYREAASVRAELARLSLHDTLTGLPNRRFLNERFDEIIRRVRREGGRVGVFFLDLDKFKAVNDTYGHEIGDQLMVAVTARITSILGPEDRLIRYGGDEFVAICPNVTSQPSAERLAARLIEALEAPFAMGQDRMRISVSIGVALTEENCTEPDDVIRDADAAMYQAKSKGSGTYAVFDRSMSDRITPSTAERRLREALDRGQFRLLYQPVVSLQTQRMVKVEALIRWEDPERGMVSPGEFIPALEDTGLIVPVGTWVLEEACRQARRWQEAYADKSPLSVTVNVSARQLGQFDFPDVLTRALAVTGVDPSLICLEITEGALMYDVEAAWTMLRTAKTNGVGLALDDFGTGFSSLSFLRKFSMDILKIDKSFVDGLGQSREDTTIIEHVIGMARGLGMVTVAEGVETADQVRYLRSLDCHMAQGFYYCKPQPPSVIDQIMGQANQEAWRPDAASAATAAAVANGTATNGNGNGHAPANGNAAAGGTAQPAPAGPPATVGIDAPW